VVLRARFPGRSHDRDVLAGMSSARIWRSAGDASHAVLCTLFRFQGRDQVSSFTAAQGMGSSGQLHVFVDVRQARPQQRRCEGTDQAAMLATPPTTCATM